MPTDYSLDHGLPANPEAERSILGAILQNNALIFEALANLRGEHFFIAGHREIYETCAHLASQGKPIELIGLTEELRRRNRIEAVGGDAFVSSLTDGVPWRSSLEHHISIVREKANLRAVIHAGHAMATQGIEQAAKSDEILDLAEESLLTLRAESQSVNAVQHVSKFAMDCIDQFNLRAASAKNTVDFPVGIENVDRFSGGIKRMTVLAGRTGEGKSCVATQCLYANAVKGTPSILFSPEMTRDEVLMRMVAQTSEVEAWKMEKPWMMADWEKTAVREKFAELAKLPIYVDDSSGISAQEISARARLAQRRDEVGICIVDYVQLLESRGRDPRAEVSASSRALRMLGKDVMPVLVLSQMPRPQENLNKWPTKYDLKESGSLENDAYKVFIIRREVGEQNMPTGEDFMCVVKNRGGRIGVEPLKWNETSITYTAKF